MDKTFFFTRNSFRNQSFLGPSHSYPRNLSNLMLVLLLTALTNKEKAISLYSKPVFNLNFDNLYELLISCLGKVKEQHFETMPAMFDGASTNAKVE